MEREQTLAAQAVPAHAASPALVLRRGPRLEERPFPRLLASTDVVCAIEMAGLCRTDLYVADGRLAGVPGVALGHEAVGRVVDVGRDAGPIAIGQRVAFDPWLRCGACPACKAQGDAACHAPKRLGVDVDGVFAHAVALPDANVWPVPAHISAQRAAYLEPVAAAMGVLEAGIGAHERVLISEDNRIAQLTARIMERAGLQRPLVGAEHGSSCSFDVVIDAGLTTQSLCAMIDALVPGGLLVLKSRRVEPVDLYPAALVEKGLRVVAPPYGSFRAAAEALGDANLPLDDLFGNVYALGDFPAAFEEARSSEAKKVFLEPR